MWKQIQTKYLGTTIPVVSVHGPINAACSERVANRLAKLSVSRASALAVSVNSPGGLPVQSQIICNRIKQFAAKNNLQVYTFARDLAASGGYFVLCCGDKVYADRTSLVGNIGAVIPKYNLEGLLEMTSLQNKSIQSNKESLRDMLNPFHNMTPEEKEKLLKTTTWIHQKFIEHVKRYRGSKLKKDDKIFEGQIYNGTQAKQLGLIDEVGSMIDVLQKNFPGSKLEFEDAKSWKNVLQGLV